MSLILNCLPSESQAQLLWLPPTHFPTRPRLRSHLHREEHAYGRHLSNILHNVKGFFPPSQRQPMWQMMYVFLQACDYQHRDAVQCSSPHQFHKLHSKVCETFAARWLLTCSQAGAFCCEYLTPDFLPIGVRF